MRVLSSCKAASIEALIRFIASFKNFRTVIYITKILEFFCMTVKANMYLLISSTYLVISKVLAKLYVIYIKLLISN